MKYILVLLALSGCSICPIEAAKDNTLVCELHAGDRCLQYARSGSLLYGPRVWK